MSREFECPTANLLEFPLDHTIKVFLSLDGRDPHLLGEELARRAVETIEASEPRWPTSLLSTTRNLSSKGAYVCYSMTFRAHSREELDALYLELRRHPGVKMML